MEQYFYCYSYPLKEFLTANNEKFILHSVHEKTGKKFWVFNGTKELNSLLSLWKTRKH